MNRHTKFFQCGYRTDVRYTARTATCEDQAHGFIGTDHRAGPQQANQRPGQDVSQSDHLTAPEQGEWLLSQCVHVRVYGHGCVIPRAGQTLRGHPGLGA